MVCINILINILKYKRENILFCSSMVVCGCWVIICMAVVKKGYFTISKDVEGFAVGVHGGQAGRFGRDGPPALQCSF